jgi:non-heme chloroperoxidase
MSEKSVIFVALSDGTKLRLYQVGSGPTILLVHGWSGSSQSFQRNVADLSQNFKVISYDQRFHGASDKPDFGFHIARLAADLHELIEHLELHDVTVVGASMVRFEDL